MLVVETSSGEASEVQERDNIKVTCLSGFFLSQAFYVSRCDTAITPLLSTVRGHKIGDLSILGRGIVTRIRRET